MKIEIFTHRNCIECNILIEWLERKNLLSKVQIIDTELYPFLAAERGVLSTPSVFIDGKLIYAGVVDYEEFERILEENKIILKIIDKEELVNKLMNGIVNSFAVTAWIYINRDFDALLAQKDFVLAITGLVFSDNAEEGLNYLRNIMLKEGEKYLEEWKERMIRNIANNFIRELYWLYERKLELNEMKNKYPIEVFAHWLMVRGGAIGRVGLRIHKLSDINVMKRILEVYSYIIDNYDKIWDKIISEQNAIKLSLSKRILNL
jgi:predicted thioredoxin/glutaredoxin